MASVLNLSKRLEAIVNVCPDGRTVADIGCDHGYVTAELILEDKVNKVIATEKSPECLNKAVYLASSINILPFISFRQGDGFGPITKYDKLDYAIIAGMG
ncbi:MAG: tRNA (adenine(22)-N(1))-methyltransferase TrmK, partial [Clostridia bacterium]|nr:tRNA (adenine(22)-N(1))-methyltransferase TrmK [Clostridia bacterium]